jgi:hypothetical protein
VAAVPTPHVPVATRVRLSGPARRVLAMDLIRRLAELLDAVNRIVTFVRVTPSRRARAAEEGWSVATMRRVDWGVGGGRMVARLSMPVACGCRMLGSEVVLYDIDCVEHDVLGGAD